MFATLLLSAGLLAPGDLPAEWHGVWSGPLVVTAGGKPTEVPMTLIIKPLDGGRVSWTIERGEGDRKQTLPYELVPVPGKPGRFEIDEKNGIRLSARRDGDRLVMLYRVGGVLMQVRYERAGDVIHFELTTFAEADPLVTSPTGQSLKVEAFTPTGIQHAELKRRKP